MVWGGCASLHAVNTHPEKLIFNPQINPPPKKDSLEEYERIQAYRSGQDRHLTEYCWAPKCSLVGPPNVASTRFLGLLRKTAENAHKSDFPWKNLTQATPESLRTPIEYRGTSN